MISGEHEDMVTLMISGFAFIRFDNAEKIQQSKCSMVI